VLAFSEQQDLKDARKQIAVVDQGGLGLPERDYYLRTAATDEKIRTEYVQHVASTLELIGTPRPQAATDATAIMAFETALARLSLDVTARRDPKNRYHPMTVSALIALTPRFGWQRFLDATGAPKITELNVGNPEFFRGLAGVLQTTELATLKSYLRWQLIRSTPSSALPAALDAENFEFYSHKLRGQPQQQVRWKRCVRATDQALGEALGEIYVARKFPPASKAAMLALVHDIETAMDADITAIDWMSEPTKVRAKQKLQAVANKIGYPDRWRDYGSVTIARDDALGNAMRATMFEQRRELAKIGRPVERGEWGMSPPTVNAYYSSSMNDINFPAGILQAPLYDGGSTLAENYGHAGGVIGHELTHGFDDEGRQFDGNGNLEDWWTPEDGKRFDDHAACEIDEYGSFVAVDDVKLNGKLTLGENTADNGGLRLAYAAFLVAAQRAGLDLTKSEDGYTPPQQFFLGHGQNWCGGLRPEQTRLQVQTDPHSLNEFRVNGVVRNMPEFGQAFSCKAGQPMMPTNVCRVW
jgi:endothelin-converting enzyme/putative endopeptidase